MRASVVWGPRTWQGKMLLFGQRVWFWTAVVACSTVAACQAAQGDSEIVLQEESNVTLPEQFNLLGVSMSSNGGILAWGEPNRILLFSQTLELERSLVLDSAITPMAAWFDSDNDLIEIVSASQPTVFYVDLDGAVLQATEVGGDGVILSSARGERGWYVLSESLTTGAITVEVLGDPSRAVVSAYGSITPDEATVWLTSVSYPFEVRQFDVKWDQLLTLRPPSQLLNQLRSAAGQQDFSSWASLPVVVLDSGYLQTIADLLLDRRLVVAYDEDGHVKATMVLDAPLGLMLGNSSLRRVYGARRTNILELVEYSYQWTDDPR